MRFFAYAVGRLLIYYCKPRDYPFAEDQHRKNDGNLRVDFDEEIEPIWGEFKLYLHIVS